MGEVEVGFTCLKHDLFYEVNRELSPKAFITLVKMLTYQPDFVIRESYLAHQLGLQETKHMASRMNELIECGYLVKKGNGQFTTWQLTHRALAYKKYGNIGRNYYRLQNDAIERLAKELCDGEIALYLCMLTNALTHKMTNAELVDRTGINKKTLSRYVNSLFAKGFLHKEEVGYNKVLWSMRKDIREKYICCGENEIYQDYSNYNHGIS